MCTRIPTMDGSGFCSNWSLFSVLPIRRIFTVSIMVLKFTYFCTDLAQNRYFEDEAFIGYLKYLQYWQRPEYVKFIMYPHCLYFLELLQNSSFRAAMAHPGNKELAHRQQFYFWKSYRNNRLKHIIPRALPEPAAPSPATSLPLIPLPSINASAAGVPSPAPSPIPYGIAPVPGLPNNDPRNNVVDRRKRKKEG
ncbi:hypothetical protein Droror1_Dr00025992 [Drosera rotundifolia]